MLHFFVKSHSQIWKIKFDYLTLRNKSHIIATRDLSRLLRNEKKKNVGPPVIISLLHSYSKVFSPEHMKLWRLLSISVVIISNNSFRPTLILSFFKNWLHQTNYLFLPICFEQLATLVSCRFIARGKFSFGAAAWNGHCLIKEFESMKMLSKLPLRFYDLCSARPFRKKRGPPIMH